MFNKRCSKCRGKIDKKYDFCPYCGKNLKSKYDNDDFGFLGKNDIINEKESFMGINNSFLDKMLNRAMKMVEKQMKDMPEFNQNNQNKNQKPYSNVKFRFMVNGKEVFPQKVSQQRQQKPIKPNNKLSKEKAEKFAKLPRKEPKTKMKRISGRLVYELSIPGVKNIEDILINQLENSIEIKALSKDKVYSKILNVNLPIVNYGLNKGNLILELQGN